MINVDGTTAVGIDQFESYTDNELAGGVAPGADIVFYTATTLDTAIDAMLTDNPDIFSLSYGACELDLTTSDNQVINEWWKQAAGQGTAVTVSTGDSGSGGCDYGTMTAVGGVKVSGYASTPYNIAVGGTDFGPLLTSFATYVRGQPSGTAANLYRTATKYIPEWTWNDSTIPNTTISANVPYMDTAHANATNIQAAGGGKSTCSVNTTTYTTRKTRERAPAATPSRHGSAARECRTIARAISPIFR